MVVLPPSGEPADYNRNYILFWNDVALDLNRLDASLAGPQGGPVLGARVLGILHIAINDAYFALKPDKTGVATTYLTANAPPDSPYRLPNAHGAVDAANAVAGAAITVLQQHYTQPSPKIASSTTSQLNDFLRQRIRAISNLDALGRSFQFGVAVGKAILSLLAIKPGEPGADAGAYQPKTGSYKFNDDPTNPVRRVPVDPNHPEGPQQSVRPYYAPFYGQTVKRVAVQMKIQGQPTEHILADPPVGFGVNDTALYNALVKDVVAEGGAPGLNSTHRSVDHTVGAMFWAYDGSNLIGTPPRLYNQILRKVAWERRPTKGDPEAVNADFARLFALANAALADAGIFAWLQKWTFEFWRPLSGVRSDQGPHADPFWLEFGAPDTNTNRIAFKPPFPAYPSGHAVFGAAFFQTARLYYKRRDGLHFADDEPDPISFSFVSDELNGINRDLRQPYDSNLPITEQLGTVRTRVERSFPSLWSAIYENAISRIWLGVHWQSDAFAAEDVLKTEIGPDGAFVLKDAASVRYKATGTRFDRPQSQRFPKGGVPLGLGIATDIFGSNLKPTPPELQPNPYTI
ncbi:MAG: hypothetical protein LQ346_004902 [Caloplaca aetnensis]|nr:MAG: hypothetical protein LQ346_004902 [Caloplaca aetnensis]